MTDDLGLLNDDIYHDAFELASKLVTPGLRTTRCSLVSDDPIRLWTGVPTKIQKHV